eukprot:m.292787 g.292787  ORF g.292787 m.292787 type:complete len:4258 (-) comp17829_c0_seq1:6294-19067(-)
MPLSLRRSRLKRLINQHDESVAAATANQPSSTASEPLPRISDARLFVSDGLSLVANTGSIPFEPTSAPPLPQWATATDRLRVPGALALQYQNLHTFRQAALKAIWALEEQAQQASAVPSPSPGSQKAPAAKSNPQVTKSSGSDALAQLTLALLTPLLESQSAVDSSLIGNTVQALLLFLQTLSPSALKNTAPSALRGLERVLRNWLHSDASRLEQANVKLEDIASALTAFALSRDSLEAYVDLLHVLLTVLPEDCSLPLADFLRTYAGSQVELRPPVLEQAIPMQVALQASSNSKASSGTTTYRHPKHQHPLVKCQRESGWNCDGSCGHRSSRGPARSRYRCRDGCDYDLCGQCMAEVLPVSLSIASDGCYIYIADNEQGLFAKVGTGRQGTIDGHVYAQNSDSPDGTLAYADALVLRRFVPFLRSGLGEIVDPHSLLTTGVVLPPANQVETARDDNRNTLQMWGDGRFLYRMRTRTNADKKQDVFVDQYRLEVPASATFATIHEADSPRVSMKLSLSKFHYGTLAEPHVIVSDIQSSSPFYEYLSVGDAILSLNDLPVNTVEEVESRLAEIKSRAKSRERDRAATPQPSEPPSDAADSEAVSRAVSVAATDGSDEPETLGVQLRVRYMKRSVQATLVRTTQLTAHPSSETPSHQPTTAGFSEPTFRSSNLLATGDSFLMVKLASSSTSTSLGLSRSSNDHSHLIEHYAFDLNTGASLSPNAFLMTRVQTSATLDLSRTASLAFVTDPSNSCFWSYTSEVLECWPWTASPLRIDPPGHNTDVITTLGEGYSSSRHAVVMLLSHMALQASICHVSVAAHAISLRNTKDSTSSSSNTPTAVSRLAALAPQEALKLLAQLVPLTFADPPHEASTLNMLLTCMGNILRKLELEVGPFQALQMDTAGVIKDIRTHLLEYLTQNNPNTIAVHEGLFAALGHGNAVLFSTKVDLVALIKVLLSSDTTGHVPLTMRRKLLKAAVKQLTKRQPRFFEPNQQGTEEESSGEPQTESSEAEQANDLFPALLDVLLEASENETVALVSALSSEAESGLPVSSTTTTALATDVLKTLLHRVFSDSTRTAYQQKLGKEILLTCERIITDHIYKSYQALSGDGAANFAAHVSSLLPVTLLGVALPYELYEPSGHSDEPSLQRLFKACMQASASYVSKQQRTHASASLSQPWTSGVRVETIHPVHDNYQFKKTVRLANSPSLYLMFDPRCSSQYDYDKVSIYAGDSNTCPRVAEYGGNAAGIGSGLLGKGWPTTPVRVPGDTVTFEFEMRSGRESATPDSVVFGFAVEVRGNETDQQALFKPALGLEFQLSQLHVLLKGAARQFKILPMNETEQAVLALFNPTLKATINWDDMDVSALGVADREVTAAMFDDYVKPATSQLTTAHLKTIFKCTAFKPLSVSTRLGEALHITDIQRLSLVHTLNHVGALSEVVAACQLVEDTADTDHLNPYLSKLLRLCLEKLRPTLRKLVGLANLEKQWHIELEERVEASKQAGASDESAALPSFKFAAWQHEDTHTTDLRDLCLLFCPDYRKADSADMVAQLALEMDRQVTAGMEQASISLEASHTIAFADVIVSRCQLLARLQQCNAVVSHGSPTSERRVRAGMERTLSRSLSGGRGGLHRQLSAPPLLQKQVSHRRASSSTASEDPNASAIAAHLSFVCMEVFGSPTPVDGLAVCKAMKRQQQRAAEQVNALSTMQQLLELCAIETAPLLTRRLCVETCKDLLATGQHTHALTLGGQLKQYRKALQSIVQAVLALVEQNPKPLHAGLGLFAIPFESADASLLSGCGLLSLLTRLCHSKEPSIHATAWYTFEAVSAHCIRWETETPAIMDSPSYHKLISEMASLLGEQLLHAVQALSAHEGGDLNEAVDATFDLLSLLDSIAASSLGEMVLANAECTIAMLTLLVSPLTVPQVMRVLLRLLAIALPLVQVTPAMERLLQPLLERVSAVAVNPATPHHAVIQLILTRLASLVAPVHFLGLKSQHTTPRKPSRTSESPATPVQPIVPSAVVESTPPARPMRLAYAPQGSSEEGTQSFHEHDLQLLQSPYAELGYGDDWSCNQCRKTSNSLVYHCKPCHFDLCMGCALGIDNTPPSDEEGTELPGEYVVRLHRRSDQSARDIIHPLLKIHRRPFGGAGDHEPIENIMRIDRELNSSRSVIAFRGGYRDCTRKAAEWASVGTVVSVERGAKTSARASTKTKASEDKLCHQRNVELMKGRTSRRSFLSAAAAGECTQLLISLIHNLVASEEVAASASVIKPWTVAIDAVLDQVLSTLPITVEWISGTVGQPTASHLEDASLALAAVSVLGGFREEVHVGAQVIVARKDLEPAIGVVDTLDQNQNEAVIEFEDGLLERVPLSCVQSQFDDPPESLRTMVPVGFRTALEALLHKGNGQPVGVQAVAAAELSYEAIAAGHRALAELRTRACMVLALRLQHPELAQDFLDTSENALNIVVRLAREAQRVAGDAMPVLEAACARYRAAFLEKERPKIVPLASGGKGTVASMTWNTLQELPRLQGVVFNPSQNSVQMIDQRRSERDSGRSSLAIVFGTSSIPSNADVYYFEVEILRLGADTSPSFGMGLSPLPGSGSQKASDFKWPAGSVVLYNNSSVCYQRSSDSQERLDHSVELKGGDVIGCGWLAESSKIVFTHNGQLVQLSVQGVPRSSHPVLFLADSGAEIKANFGAKPFAFNPDGLRPPSQEVQAEAETDGPSDLFSMSLLADSDDEDSFLAAAPVSKHTVDYRTIELGSITSGCLEDSSYSLVASGSTMSGSLVVGVGEDEAEEENMTDKLVKAWEAEVFPKIASRFRSSQERRSGQDQIRGALQLGMEDMARMIIEGLYEENGNGIPSDVHFPTSEELKEAGTKLAADQIKTSMNVRITTVAERSEFETEEMAVTRNQMGVVTSVDDAAGLALVDVYLSEQARLLQCWFPISVLEEVESAGIQKVDKHVHAELLSAESKLTRLTCRQAVLRLFNQPSAPNVSILSPLDLMRLNVLSRLRPSLPARCLSQHHSILQFFDSDHESDLIDAVSRVLQQCTSTTALVQLVDDACHVILDPGQSYNVAQMPVEVGRRTYDVSFERGAAIFVSVKAWQGGSVKPFVSSTKEGPWARFYVGTQGTGPQFAILPFAGTSLRTPVPTLLFTTKQIHVRTTAQEEHPNALIEARLVPEDFPMAMLLIQRFLCDPKSSLATRVTTSVKAKLLWATLRLVTNANLGPALRESLLQTAALLLRACGAEDAKLAVCTDALSELLQETIKMHKHALAALETCRHSTQMQALMEVALAAHDVFGDDAVSLPQPPPPPQSAPPKLADDAVATEESESSAVALEAAAVSEGPASSAETPSGLSFAMPSLPSAGRRKLKAKRGHRSASATPMTLTFSTPTSRKDDDNGELPEWYTNARDALRLCRALSTESAAGKDDDSRRNVIKNGIVDAWSDVVQEKPIEKLLFVSDIRPTLTLEAVRKHLKSAISQYGGIHQENDIVIGVNAESSELSNGIAVVKLKSAALSRGFAAALHEDVALGIDGRVTVRPVALSQGNPACLMEANMTFAGWPTNASHSTSEQEQSVLSRFFQARLVNEDGLTETLRHIVLSLICSATVTDLAEMPPDVCRVRVEDVTSARPILVSDIQASVAAPAALVKSFLSAIERKGEQGAQAAVEGIRDGDWVTAGELLQYTFMQASDRPQTIALALLMLGYDLDLQRNREYSQLEALNVHMSRPFSFAADMQLVSHVDAVASALHTDALALNPSDITFTEVDKLDSAKMQLRGYPLRQLRLRFAFLKALNQRMAATLPLLDLRSPFLHDSCAAVLNRSRGLLFYVSQCKFVNGLIHDTASRVDPKGPEVNLDPLETLSASDDDETEDFETVGTTVPQFYQAARQVEQIDPVDMRVKIASGGDPNFPLIIKLSGERVAGNSGSFREFMQRMATELQSDMLPLLMRSPAAAMGRNAGCWIIRPGPIDYSVWKKYYFLGQLFGLAFRSDVPLPLDLLPSFWKALIGEELTRKDVYDCDKLLDDRLTFLEQCTDEEDFAKYVLEHKVTYRLRSLAGDEIEMSQPSSLVRDDGSSEDAAIKFEHRLHYISNAQRLRLDELRNPVAFEAIREGLKTIVPVEVLSAVSSMGLSRRLCGLPDIDLNYLKRHTTYTSGLGESDTHIIAFWEVLESFSQAELRKFVKFACNQERIPSAGGEQGGTLQHVPPFPMKLAPPDDAGKRSGDLDQRFIRAETCMFMIKLPQYSSKEIMKTRLLQAINCREDPLVG